jgi:Bifunctional DNA primase/polymerase, N-terminal/AAA domain
VSALLEVAISCIRRGWFVFPCVPRDKRPLAGLAPRGFLDATNDEAVVRKWWAAKPDANVAIATGPSGLVVVDIDHGLTEAGVWPRWIIDCHTYAVRTGRRPEFGLQLYFQADGLRNNAGWEKDGLKGDIRADGGYVMAAGSIHPSGQAYAELNGDGVAPSPEWVLDLAPEKQQFDAATAVDDETADGWKTWLLEYCDHYEIEVRDYEKRVPNGWWLGIKCPWEHESGDGVESSTVLGILDGKVAFQCQHGTCMRGKRSTVDFKRLMVERRGDWIAEPGADVQVVLSGKTVEALSTPKEPVDWHTRYMTEESYRNVKPPEFLVDGFLVKDSIAMLGGPVAQRKSIIALNIAHALCTGDALFGYFKVAEKPTRTVYLCPEMGAASFVKRIKQIGLGGYVGKTLFIQTMSEPPTVLDELDGELPGAVVIVDTITRFIEGDENKSEDMRQFAQKVFRLVNAGATVVLLHHSKKGSSGSLDDGLRGSSELAAFVDSCWVTELDDPTKPYESLSKIRNVKQRDFESDPFRLKPSPGSFYLTMEGDPAPEAVIRGKKEQAAREALADIVKANPAIGILKARDALKAKGFGKGPKFITAVLSELRGGGATLVSD